MSAVRYEPRLENESDAYREARAALQQAEIELKNQRERVAAMRRDLPLDTAVQDYAFSRLSDQGVTETVRLSELFGEHDTLVLMHFMFGKAQKEPCPMCTLWADGYSGIARHLQQRVAFAVVAADRIEDFARYAQQRGWEDLTLLSAEPSSFKADLETEMPNGQQLPAVSVFRRLEDGSVRHFYTGSALFGSGENREFRGLDLLSPFWNFLDLTPEGREDWMPQVEY